MKIKVRLTLPANLTKFSVQNDTIVDVEMEEYLKAVVASEIADSHIEACKAQAVASRTFAVRQMKNRGYLYDNTNDQVYIHSRNDAERYKNAILGVEQTSGEILTYKGTVLLYAPFGASNSGLTLPYKNYPYLIAQNDPWDAAETAKRQAQGLKIKVGNRMGLSQYGARYAADNGIGYRKILSFYYPTSDITANYGEEVREVSEKRQLNEKEKMMASWARTQVGSGYVWGSTGQKLTEAVLTSLIARHGTNINEAIVRKWMGKKVYDCAGLITSAFSTHLGLRVVSGVSSQWKGNYWEVKGTIDTLPKDFVCALYKEKPTANPMQHGGLYLGDGTVVDARGSKSGVVFSKLEDYPWSHWAIPKGMLTSAEIAEIKAIMSGVPYNGNPQTGGSNVANTAKVNGSKLALRRDMSTKNNPITRINTGSIVEILEKVNADWWKVQTSDKQVGYVMSKYVTELNVVVPNPDNDDGEAGQDEIEDNQFMIHLLCKDKQEAEAMLNLLKNAVLG